MKPVNLLSLVSAKNDLLPSVFGLYLNNFDIKIKEDELRDIESLIKEIQTHSERLGILDEFYIGYTINQIGKEFDLLRFGENSIINIELKRTSTEEKIRKQLKKNKYYLNFLEKEVLSFTYVVEDRQLFYLNDSETLEKTKFPFLISKLNDQVLQYIEDINRLFDPSNYLVSPFNSTDAFVSGQYFLTDHQETVKNDILNLSTETGPCFISIEGHAGTGKTLLTYDIAKQYISIPKSVLIFHCGNLNNGHYKLSEKYPWEISPIKDYKLYDLSKYDLIIIDEAQRIYKNQLEIILNSIKNTNAKCIFSYDSQQCLSADEIKRNIPQYIIENVSPKIFRLTEKIRTNKEIASFIKNLFDLSKKNQNQKYSNINIRYFSCARDAKQYIDVVEDRDWKVINYTPPLYNDNPYKEFQYGWNDNAHNVIGQEYDNVIAVLDHHFYYNEDRKLSTKGWYGAHYNPTKMLFQIVTRARKKLGIVIINNEAVLKQCLNILGLK
ncbi:DNA/RNA helicase domain-containing protein [Aneurinibacillus soli]|nr:DNA/RNA helicase domain-containing protein [Aneurinibacillus soli]